MKLFYLAHAGISLLGAVLLGIYLGQAECFGFSVGAVLTGLNVGVIQYAWSKIFGKKSVAWPVTVIVLKYTLLGIVLYQVVTYEILPILWFGVGVGSIAISAAVFVALLVIKRTGNRSGSSL